MSANRKLVFLLSGYEIVEPEPVLDAHCPLCGSGDIRASYPKPILDDLLGLLKLHPLRCRSCRRRFYRRISAGETPLPPENESRPEV